MLWTNKQDNIARLAFLLYLLSYKDLKKDYKNLNDKEEEFLKEIEKYQNIFSFKLVNFDREFEKWNQLEKYRYKRLWASLRDYLKLTPLSDPFLHFFNLSRNWETLFQLEFPGDIWNIRFAEKVLEPILTGEKIANQPILQGNNVSRSMRRMFRWFGAKSNYYPEQFDVSFDFTSRMCEKQFCDLCPFGEGSVKICFEGKNRGKNCPVALFTCK